MYQASLGSPKGSNRGWCDGFVAGMLSGLLVTDLTWGRAAVEKALSRGNAVGALSTTQIGAMSSLPSLDMVQSLLQLTDVK